MDGATGAVSAADRLRTRLRADLLVAMRDRRALEVTALRTLIAAIDNAGAVPVAEGPYRPRRFGDGSAEVPRRWLDDVAVRAVIDREIAERRAAADDFERGGRAELAEPLRAAVAIIARYR